MSVKTLTIDGKAVTGDEDQTILSVADEVGISIPRLCFLEGLGLIGACRLCVVEIEGSVRVTTSSSGGSHGGGGETNAALR